MCFQICTTLLGCQSQTHLPFDFVKQDKYITTVFAWRKENSQTKIQYSIAKYSTKPNVAQFCMQDFGGAGTAALRLPGICGALREQYAVCPEHGEMVPRITALLTRAPHSTSNQKFISPEWQAFQAKNKEALVKYPRRPRFRNIFQSQ